MRDGKFKVDLVRLLHMGRILLFDGIARDFIIFEKGRSFGCFLLVDIVKQIGKFIVFYFLFAF